jgi:hypothetical protein
MGKPLQTDIQTDAARVSAPENSFAPAKLEAVSNSGCMFRPADFDQHGAPVAARLWATP